MMRDRPWSFHLILGLIFFNMSFGDFAGAEEPRPRPIFSSPPLKHAFLQNPGEEYLITGLSEIEWDEKFYIVADVAKRSLYPTVALARAATRGCPESLREEDQPLHPKRHGFISVLAWSGFLATSALVVKSELPTDKKYHYVAGVVAAAAGNGLARLILPRDTPHYALKAALIGLGTAVFVGAGKEVYDKRSGTGTYDLKGDGLATAGGGLTVSIAFVISDFGKKK